MHRARRLLPLRRGCASGSAAGAPAAPAAPARGPRRAGQRGRPFGGEWDLAALCCLVLLMPYAAALALGEAGGGGGGGWTGHYTAAPAGYAGPLAWYDDAVVAAFAPWGARHGGGGPFQHLALPHLLPPAHAQAPVAPAAPAAAAPPAFTASYAGEFGHAGAEYGRFRSPGGAAATPDGRIVVADTGNDRIVVLDASGAHVHTFGTRGAGEGQLDGPNDVAVDPDGRIVVADRANGRVSVFHPNYTHALSFGPEGPGIDAAFQTINGIAVGADGGIVVADHSAGAGRVRVFDADGTYRHAVGVDSAPFGTVWDVAAGPDGRVAVLDESYGSLKIRVFRGELAPDDATVDRAHRPSIAMDLSGRILLSDGSGSGSVRVYDDRLNKIATVETGTLTNARLAVAPDGRVLVADPVKHRVVALGTTLGEHEKAGECDSASEPRGVSAVHGGRAAVVAYGSGHIGIVNVPDGDCEIVQHGVDMDPAGAVLLEGGGNRYVVADRGVGEQGGRVIVLADSNNNNGAYEMVANIVPPGEPGFVRPSGIAVGRDGRVLVSDSGANAVFVASEREDGSEAWTVTRIGSGGSGPGQFDSPGGVAAGPNRTIWVADTGNNRVQVLDADGRHVRTIAGGGRGGFTSPTAVAVDAYGRAIVAGMEGTVLVGAMGGAPAMLDKVISGVAVTDGGYAAAAYSATGTVHILSIGASPAASAEYFTTGTDAGAFARPAGVAVAPGGRIVVADTGNDRVQVFTPTALHLFSFGSSGSARLNMDSPGGVAVGANGTIVVADTGNDRVQVYGPLGGHLRTVQGANNTGFSSPAGVAVGANGSRVYVADAGNDRVVELAAPGYGHVRTLAAGSNNTALDGPAGVAEGPDGRVYVADAGNARVQIFEQGNALHAFSGTDQGLQRPHGIAAVESPPAGCGPLGYKGPAIAVSDAAGDGVHWFSQAGGHLCSAEGFGMPLGVAQGAAVGRAAGAAASLVVADTGNSRVDVLGASGERVASLYQPNSAGEFTRRLMDVAVNATGGAVLVADADRNRVLAFDREGNPVFAVGLKGSGSGSFDRPMGIAVAPAGSPWPGRIAVADTGNGRVQVLDAAGRHVLTAGNDGTLAQPGSVAVDGRGRIIVADTERNSRIFVFEADGTRVTALDGTALGRYRSGSLVGPTDVAVGPGGEIVVADATVGRVHVYDPNGTLINSFVTRVPGSVLPYMRDVAVDPHGRILVVDARNHQIEVFTMEGVHAGTISRHGSADGEFQRASGIDAGPGGRIAAADALGMRVHFFETPALHVASIYNGTGPGGGVLAMNGPRGAAALPDGRIAVADTGNHRLLIVDPVSGNATAVGRGWGGAGEFSSPEGVAGGGSGAGGPGVRIAVADTGNKRVQVLNSTGGHIATIDHDDWSHDGPDRVAMDGAGNVAASLINVHVFNASGAYMWTARAEYGTQAANGVAFDAAGRLQVVWTDYWSATPIRNQLVVYNQSGGEVRRVNTTQFGGMWISIVNDLAVDLRDRAVVADTSRNRISVFGPDGAALYTFGSNGSADGQFNMPRGVHVGPGGRIIVADTGNDRVQVLGNYGVHHGTFSMRSFGDGRLSLPQGLAADSEGRYIVADTGNDRVQVFGAGGEYERTFGARGTAHANLASQAGVAVGPRRQHSGCRQRKPQGKGVQPVRGPHSDPGRRRHVQVPHGRRRRSGRAHRRRRHGARPRQGVRARPVRRPARGGHGGAGPARSRRDSGIQLRPGADDRGAQRRRP